jgi:hypothetical protein
VSGSDSIALSARVSRTTFGRLRVGHEARVRLTLTPFRQHGPDRGRCMDGLVLAGSWEPRVAPCPLAFCPNVALVVGWVEGTRRGRRSLVVTRPPGVPGSDAGFPLACLGEVSATLVAAGGIPVAVTALTQLVLDPRSPYFGSPTQAPAPPTEEDRTGDSCWSGDAPTGFATFAIPRGAPLAFRLDEVGWEVRL